MSMTKSELFTEYAAYHADRRNRACHAVGIPLILLGTMGILHLVAFGPVDLAIVAGVATLLYYAFIDPRGALISTLMFAIIYEIAIRVPWQVALAALVVGWIFQLVGHRFEGTKPKFLENLVYLLIGPLYFFEEIVDSVLGV
ncbi:MAG TPA: Mpo1-like protein [Alphaproteobacteria bacterium]|nr:Mpo1-like protein [Alphaproteobacteria bacterium]